jgi:hypothetical protein
MSEQALDLRTVLGVLRRHRLLLAGTALLGFVGGMGYAVAEPPLYSSTSMVLLPQPQETQQTPADPQTQVRVAGSAAVLGPAGKLLQPQASAGWMAGHIKVSAPSATVLEFHATDVSEDRVTELAQAAADAEVGYVKDAATVLLNTQRTGLQERERTLQASLDAVGAQIMSTTKRRNAEGATTAAGRDDSTALAQLTAEQADLTLQLDQVKQQSNAASVGTSPSRASVIQPATPPRRPELRVRAVEYGAAGAGLAVGLVLIGLALFARRDRRLRYRDQIADALGSTVVASVRTRPPHTVAGWSELMAEYEPSTSDAWALRQVLRLLDVGEHRPRTVTLVTLAGDQEALAIGPQLASYAASTGMRARLIAAQRHDTAAPLWASCHRAEAEEEARPGLYVGGGGSPEDVLTVVLVVLDRRRPAMAAPPRSDLTLVGVSAGGMTAEDLARAAITVDDAGVLIGGMVVANPDDLDRSTGRLPQRERGAEAALPNRVAGAPEQPTRILSRSHR